MALPLVANRIYAVTRTLIEAGSAQGTHIGQNIAHGEGEKAAEETLQDVKFAAWSTFGMLGDTGRANAMAWDVVLSAFVVGLWLAFAEADPSTMLRSTLLPWLKDEDEVAYERPERTAASTKKRQIAMYIPAWFLPLFDPAELLKSLSAALTANVLNATAVNKIKENIAFFIKSKFMISRFFTL